MSGMFRWFFNGENKETVVKKGKKKIAVSENSNSKTFSIDGVVQSIVMKNSLYTKEYWDIFPQLCYLFDKPKVLMIGLGGGTIVQQMNAKFGDNVTVEVVEVDKGVVDLSRRFFGLGDRCRIIIGDGAKFVRRKKGAYDIVILDAYEGEMIPLQFLESQFVKDARNSLKHRGILAINYISTMRYNGRFEGYLGILSESFDTYVIDPKEITKNSVIVCMKNMNKTEAVEKLRAGVGTGRYDSLILSAYENMEPAEAESYGRKL